MRSCLENVQRLDAAPDTTSRNMKMMELVKESQHFNSQWIELGNAGEVEEVCQPERRPWKISVTLRGPF